MTKQEFIQIKINQISMLLERVKEYKECSPTFYDDENRNMVSKLEFFVSMMGIESILNESLDRWKHMLDVVNSEKKNESEHKE